MTRNIDPALTSIYLTEIEVREQYAAKMKEGGEFYVEFHKANGESRAMLVMADIPADCFDESAAPRRESKTAINIVDADLYRAAKINGLDPKTAWRAFNVYRVTGFM